MDNNKHGLRHQSNLICLVFILYIAAGRGLGVAYRAALNGIYISETQQSLLSLFVYLLAIAVPIFFLKRGWSARQLIAGNLCDKLPRVIWFYLSVYCAVFVTNIASNSALGLLGLSVKSGSPALPVNTAALLVYILNYTVAPAVLEEILFRGIIISRLRPYGDKLAIVVSALLFASVHFNITTFAGIFLMGLLLGSLAVRNNSLVPGIAVHFLNNAIALVFIFAGKSFASEIYNAMTAIFFILCVIAAFAAFIFVFLKHRNIRLEKKAPPLSFFKGIPAIILVVLLVLLMAERIGVVAL